MAHQQPESFINSLIGEGSFFKGDLTVKGLLRIDGDFLGTVTTDFRVLIGTQGRARATFHASEVIIGGAVKGDIYASQKVVIYSTGLVLGNIYAPSIQVEDGAVVEGYCCITPRLREEGTKPVQNHTPFTLKIDRNKVAAARTWTSTDL